MQTTIETPTTSSVTPEPAPKFKKTSRRSLGDWIVLAAIVAFALAVVFPFIVILINSFKSPTDYATGSPLSLPTSIYLDGITTFWERVNFPEKVWNSFFIAGVVAVLAVVISVLNAYAIGIGRVKDGSR